MRRINVDTPLLDRMSSRLWLVCLAATCAAWVSAVAWWRPWVVLFCVIGLLAFVGGCACAYLSAMAEDDE
jgi:hypothetical protein